MAFAPKAGRVCVSTAILFLFIVCLVPVKAAIIPSLNSVGSSASGGNFVFSYTADLQQDERLDSGATSGVTCPGVNNTKTLCDPSGTFFTIYDVPDFVAASAPAGWTASSRLLGLTPSSVNGPSIDLPGLINVTFTYTGPILHANGVIVGIPGFTIVSKDGSTAQGFFSFQATKDAGDNIGNTDQGAGPTTVPSATGVISEAAVPEPESILLLGFGLVAVGLCGRFLARRS